MRKLIYFISSSLALIGIVYFVYRDSDIEKHCNCQPRVNLKDTLDLSAIEVIVDNDKPASFITDLKSLNETIGPASAHDSLLACAGLLYKKLPGKANKYFLIHIDITSSLDHASVIDKAHGLEYDNNYKIGQAVNHFKRSTQCIECSDLINFNKHCCYTVACKNGITNRAKFVFARQFLVGIVFFNELR